MKKFLSYLIPFLVVIGGITIVFQIFVHTVGESSQYVLLCDADATVDHCSIAKATFDYDGMDGIFSVTKIQTSPDKVETFSSDECWIKPEGSHCRKTVVNDNKMHDNSQRFSKITIPLALSLNNWSPTI